MAHSIFRICSAFILVAFLGSLAPLSLLQTNRDKGLGGIISQMQQLQEAPDRSSTHFKVIFSHILTTLKSTAELPRTLSPEEQATDNEKVQLVVTVKLTYFLPTSPHLDNPLPLNRLYPENLQLIYTSHISSPEIVPPITSC